MTTNAKGLIKVAVANRSQQQFYREFLMARQSFSPRDFGIDLDKEAFIDQMCDDFNDMIHGQLTVELDRGGHAGNYISVLDEVLLRPRLAIEFCDQVRRKHGYFDLPDDIILRAVMQRRKNPNA